MGISSKNKNEEENKMKKLIPKNRKVRVNLLQGDVDGIIMTLEDSEEDNNEYLIKQLQKYASEDLGGKKEENKMNPIPENNEVRVNLLQGDVDRIIMTLEKDNEEEGYDYEYLRYLINQLQKKEEKE